jgi:glutamate-1-semialdehyde aminotransferase
MTQESKVIGQGIWAEAAQQLISGDVLTGQSASATGQANATAITADITVFSTVIASGAAILPVNAGSADILVMNGQASNALLVFPPVGGTINGGSANASYSQAVSKCARYVTADGLNWYAMTSA